MVLRAHPKFKKIFSIVNSGRLGKIYILKENTITENFTNLQMDGEEKYPFTP